VTVIVSRLPEDRIARRRAKRAASGSQRSRRVAGSRRRNQAEATTPVAPETTVDETVDELEPVDADVVDADVVDADDRDGADGGDEVDEVDDDDDGADEAEEVTVTDETNGDTAEEKGK
jgi:hypothetical protein